MNYYGAKELAGSFRTVRKNTIQTAEDIPEDQYGFIPAEGTRSIARTLVHIALSPQVQLAVHAEERRSSFDGFDFPALMKRLAEAEAQERTKVQVVDLLRTEGETWPRDGDHDRDDSDVSTATPGGGRGRGDGEPRDLGPQSDVPPGGAGRAPAAASGVPRPPPRARPAAGIL